MKKWIIGILVLIVAVFCGFYFTKNHNVNTKVENDTTEEVIYGIKPVEDIDADNTVEYVNELPEYVGGEEALIEFISTNFVTPESCKNLDGIDIYRIFVQFIIEKDGSLTEVETIDSDTLYKELNDEAVRVVKSMPNWIPGTVDGQPVRFRFVLPIIFKN